jgi:cellulose synthase (UDP-forming)
LRSGYRLSDLLRGYALNLLWVPILLGGTVQSLRQAWSGQPLPFRRTPKISDRTAAPPTYLTAACGVALYAFSVAVWDGLEGDYWHLVFSRFNGMVMVYAIVRFTGVQEMSKDLSVWLRQWPVTGARAKRLLKEHYGRARARLAGLPIAS